MKIRIYATPAVKGLNAPREQMCNPHRYMVAGLNPEMKPLTSRWLRCLTRLIRHLIISSRPTQHWSSDKLYKDEIHQLCRTQSVYPDCGDLASSHLWYLITIEKCGELQPPQHVSTGVVCLSGCDRRSLHARRRDGSNKKMMF